MLTGPIDVTKKVLKRAGMELGDIDLIEVNEAFASVVLRYLQAFDLDAEKVNVNGGAIAMGHPLGATGAMLLGTLLDELERRDLATGLVTLCIGAGMELNDIDLIEVNEAFASVVLRYVQAFDLDPAKVNVNGGAIAMGHPLGATGAMILGTAVDELERRNASTALITLCIGVGMGTATIIERV